MKPNMNNKIYLSPPHMNGEENSYIEDAINSNWVAPLGPHVDAFEEELANYVGVKYAAALSSGTAALHLSLKTLDVNPGDYVFCSDLTFIASANAVGDYKSLANKIFSFYKNPKPFYKRLIIARKNIKNFSIEKNVENYESIFKKI